MKAYEGQTLFLLRSTQGSSYILERLWKLISNCEILKHNFFDCIYIWLSFRGSIKAEAHAALLYNKRPRENGGAQLGRRGEINSVLHYFPLLRAECPTLQLSRQRHAWRQANPQRLPWATPEKKLMIPPHTIINSKQSPVGFYNDSLLGTKGKKTKTKKNTWSFFEARRRQF